MLSKLSALLIRLKPYVTRRLIVSFIIFGAASFAFLNLAEEVVEQDTLGYDRAVLLAVNQLSTPWLDRTMVIATDFGGILGITVLTAIAIGFFLAKNQYRASLIVLFGVAGAGLINSLFKALFARERPDLWQQLVSESTFSFPSGHAMGSAALAASLVAALWYTRYRTPAIIIGVIYTLIIGFTRLYLGVHYPTDVIAGWTVSIAWVALVFAIFTKPPTKLESDTTRQG